MGNTLMLSLLCTNTRSHTLCRPCHTLVIKVTLDQPPPPPSLVTVGIALCRAGDDTISPQSDLVLLLSLTAPNGRGAQFPRANNG
jgi:hypothetical protein